MNRNKLIEIGNKIIKCIGSEEEIDLLIEEFNKNVPHPNGANLFFYPENFNARKFDRLNYNPTVEEVVDIALNYKPIILPFKDKG